MLVTRKAPTTGWWQLTSSRQYNNRWPKFEIWLKPRVHFFLACRAVALAKVIKSWEHCAFGNVFVERAPEVSWKRKFKPCTSDNFMPLHCKQLLRPHQFEICFQLFRDSTHSCQFREAHKSNISKSPFFLYFIKPTSTWICCHFECKGVLVFRIVFFLAISACQRAGASKSSIHF